MKVSVIGSGYVGTVTAACFAELGHNVVCIDIDPEKVDMINRGKPPIYEEGLEELLNKHVGKNIRATTDYDDAVTNTDISFICVGTPSDDNGNIDLGIVKAASQSLGSAIGKKDGYHVVVVKSTVVPETTEKVVVPIIEQASGRKPGVDFGAGMNPEFLREGKAVHDFMHPDKIVIGAIDQRSDDTISALYAGLKCQIKHTCQITHTDPGTAEMIKYVNNSFLATKISFSNEIGNICKKMGIDTYKVMEAVGKDSRISPNFLNSGAGFGGSCFPKDVKALIGKAKELGYEPGLLESVINVNEVQPLMMIDLLESRTGDLGGKKIAVLGLAFKNDTDDIRESRSIPVIRALLDKGAKVSSYDPMAADNMKAIYPDIEYCDSAIHALKGANGCLVMTEWDEFKGLCSEFKVMHRPLVVDGRNMIQCEDIEYVGLCW
ncbi:MAG: UDP-glucose/GDP-mannose dehydrogenase family protein [Methanosarcinales archaeon]|nr:UDP-glucose/GDP-mannose dehydrogenase family protein [Methanosarcinales archaeon]